MPKESSVPKLGHLHKSYTRPIRILYIHHTFRNQSGSFLLWNIAKRIDKTKYQVFAACLREGGPYEAKLRDIGVEVINFDLKTLLDIRIIFRLVRYIKQNNIDIVETAVFPSDVYGRISAKLANVPIIISTMHRVEDYKQELIYRFLFFSDTLTMPLTTRIIAVSKAVKNYLISWHKIRPSKISVVYNGIDIHEYNSDVDVAEVRRSLNLREDIPIVAFIGRIVSIKGLKYFLEAARNILEQGHLVQFLVVGDGPLREHFTKQVHHHNLDKHISFVGFRKNIPNILAAIDILAVPSLWEGLPLTVLEAMSAGKPVIAARVGGIPEAVIHGETGILIPPRDSIKLADAIHNLLKDSQKRNKMGEKARERMLMFFEVERMVKEYESIYDECVTSQMIFE